MSVYASAVMLVYQIFPWLLHQTISYFPVIFCCVLSLYLQKIFLFILPFAREQTFLLFFFPLSSAILSADIYLLCIVFLCLSNAHWNTVCKQWMK